MDIRPPRPSKPRPVVTPTPVDYQLSAPLPELLLEEHASIVAPLHRKRRRLIGALIGLLVAGGLIFGGSFLWYMQQLQPVNAQQANQKERVVIEPGSARYIAAQLHEKGLIRNEIAFLLYAKLTKADNKLQAGTYSLSPSYSVAEIVDHFVNGKVDEFRITFYPGGTLAQHKKALKKAGYSDKEIDTAFRAAYNMPLFEGRPANSSLEGYIYGETYTFSTSATVEDILLRTFEEFQAALTTNKLKEGFKNQGLNLYQGLIVASIVQREVPNPQDQRQVAQVFLKRYREGMTLGSDITAYYGAELVGQPKAVSVDTPYNTRLHTGLTPTPIASPGLTALTAVADPASGDYLYFLSGDDEITYFARTDAEHEANIRAHCAKKCAVE